MGLAEVYLDTYYSFRSHSSQSLFIPASLLLIHHFSLSRPLVVSFYFSIFLLLFQSIGYFLPPGNILVFLSDRCIILRETTVIWRTGVRRNMKMIAISTKQLFYWAIFLFVGCPRDREHRYCAPPIITGHYIDRNTIGRNASCKSNKPNKWVLV